MQNILVHIDGGEASGARVSAAKDLAARLGVPVRGLIIASAPTPPYGPGAAGLASAMDMLTEQVRKEAAEIYARARSEYEIEADIIGTVADRLIIDAASAMRMAGLVVIAPPTNKDGSYLDNDVFEAALFSSGRPALMVPGHWRKPIGGRALIAWKDCREAARAVHDALPLLKQADSVRMASAVSHEDPNFFGQAAAERMQAMLREAGVKLEGLSILEEQHGAGDALLRASQDADLLVMGGYGRWRMTAWLFGGVTRHMLADLRLPTLISR